MICKKCNLEKGDKMFYNGINGVCIECHKKRCNINRRTKEGVVSKIYSHQREHSVTRGHMQPSYSKGELREWLYSQRLFHELYDEWKRSGYKKDLKPSCDRIDNTKSYTLSNLRIVTWDENQIAGVKDRECKVAQLTMDGVFMRGFNSIKDAEKETGCSSKHIPEVCKGKRNSCGGYKWRYLEAVTI